MSKPAITNVLASRYASADLAEIWSATNKIALERRLWLAVLKAQQDLGIDVPDGAVADYEAVIDQIDLASIAEVVRDLFRADDQPEQSYSERQIFEAATSRLARELAAMEEVDEPRAQEKILEILRAAAAIYNKEKPAA